MYAIFPLATLHSQCLDTFIVPESFSAFYNPLRNKHKKPLEASKAKQLTLHTRKENCGAQKIHWCCITVVRNWEEEEDNAKHTVIQLIWLWMSQN